MNLYIWLTMSSCYGSIPLTLELIGRDGGLSTLHHSCREVDGRHNNKGRPKLCTPQDLRSIKRQINALRETMGTFTSNILQEEAGVNGSNSTFRRTLRRVG